MKFSTLIVCGLLICCQQMAEAQSLAPSTVRQIFSLQRGDSLEYREWTLASGCGTICTWYILKVVDSTSYNPLQDTLTIFFQTLTIHFDSLPVPINPCGQCRQEFMMPDFCPLSALSWSITYLDSSIVYFLDTTYGLAYGWATDSIYRDAHLYDNSNQILYKYDGHAFDGTTDIYADSLGIVYKKEYQELADNNTEQLIYYHKANGKTWGTPYINTGIEPISDQYDIKVFPNPVTDKFIIRANQFQGLRFQVFNVLGKLVHDIPLNAIETEESRSTLPNGVYFWRTSDIANTIKTGIIVLE